MRKHLINSVTLKTTHNHRFTRTHFHTLTHPAEHKHSYRTQKNITHTHAQSQKTMPMRQGGYVKHRGTAREKETSGIEGVLVRQGREIPHNFEFPHSRCVCISQLWKSRRRKSQSRLGKRARTRERTRDHRSLEPIAFAMNWHCKWWENVLRQNWLSNMVHADREKPQPVEVISGRHLLLFFCWLSYSMIIEHI